ncbi:MAG: hypothetical protein ACE5LX_08635, partial [Nitrospinota bacterium]
MVTGGRGRESPELWSASPSMRAFSPKASPIEKMKRILIYGAGGHAKVIFDILRAMGGWQVGAFLDDGARKGATFLGLPVLPRGALE